MFDFLKIENVLFILFFIVPGLIISFIRAFFIKNRIPTNSEKIVSYFTISMIYHSLIWPLFILIFPNILDFASTERLLQWVRANTICVMIIFIIFVLLIPVICGFLLGLNIQKEWIYTVLRRFNINLVHPISTAWDWKFSTMQEQWILVTLKDGTKYAGYCDSESSFFSSDPMERDIYIKYIYELDDENRWEPIPDKSVLVIGGEVKTIEFWSRNEETTSHESTKEK